MDCLRRVLNALKITLKIPWQVWGRYGLPSQLLRDREGLFKDKLLFGTDIDMPNQEVPQLVYLKKLLNEGEISRNTYDRIMYENAINN